MPEQATTTVVWSPQPGPQVALLQCPVFEVFYGGARGGGKTDGSIGDWLQHSSAYGEDAVGVFFRRRFKQLEEVIARTKQIFPKLGAKYNEQKAEWTMPGGGRLKFRYIEKDKDAEEYQGHSYTRVYIEEATNFPSPAPINLLRGTLRSARGVPCGLRLTGNPGGPGHNWVKSRYINPAPQGFVILKEQFLDEHGNLSTDASGKPREIERVFIPSKLTDNRLLTENDPLYVARLRQSGSEALVKAWLTGNWDIVDGAFFDEFSEERHVLDIDWVKRIPPGTIRFRAFDWGSAKPFSVGWYAVSNGKWGLPPNALFKYEEWYGACGPNKGLKMTADLVAAGIRSRESTMAGPVRYGVADPSIFIRDGGPSIAEAMAIKGVQWRRADNKRRAGWEQLRMRLVGELQGNGETKPMIYFSESCEDTLRTLPTMQHDDRDTEDLDTEGEDHAVDETRYAVMSRPWYPKEASAPGLVLPKLPGQYTINELVARERARRIEREELA